MPVPYSTDALLHADPLTSLDNWHHEGIGKIDLLPDNGGMRLTCTASHMGREGCMAFFRPTLPDLISVEYELTTRAQGGLLINYIALKGLSGEDPITDIAKLPKRTGIIADYYAAKQGLQSFHVSVSRFDETGQHTGTSNWRRNPGLWLAGHGLDPIKQLNRTYKIRLTKDRGHLQLYVDNVFAHAMMDRDASHHPIPDTGKFGFRLIGQNVSADVANFHVYQISTKENLWTETME